MKNQVKFVIVEVNCETADPLCDGDVYNVLLSIENDLGTVIFEASDRLETQIGNVYTFDSHRQAWEITQVLLKKYDVRTKVAIWESQYPNEIDITYVNWGTDKNMQVKKNRQNTVEYALES